jgi:hydroxymethylpyrimidine pyrophosphatase-like HAD family hydrolase
MNKNIKYIAVDFDGTLCENKFPVIGISSRIHQKIARWLIEMQDNGAVIILWTCREDIADGDYLSQAIQWCKDTYDLRFDYINENPECSLGYPKKVRKIYADVYIDDKAVSLDWFQP